MNDFTKKELNDILACCELYYELAQRLPDKEEESVMRKVKSMIDNYCVHEKDGKVYDGILGLSFKCIKCGNFI